MRLGVISDIHANKIALEAVLADMPAVDSLVCAGDIVGYNPWPAECLATVRDREIPTVMGNHDRAVATGTAFRFNDMARAGVQYAREHLDDDALAWLEELPDERVVADGRVKLVHGHPDDPDRYTYPEEFHAGLLGEEDVLIMGHTHVPGHESYAEGIVMNPGSVGQPRDSDPRAAYAVIDLEEMTVDQHRVTYDIDAVMDRIEATFLPERVGKRLYDGK